ncbi:MAG TPA: hypothetical protein GX742_00890, partial [Acholeplasmataceae bacterium]|nr:hypothetical protein [Acholeplasmataceae bacterium]
MSKRILIIVALMLSLVLIGCMENEEVIHSVSFETFGGQYIQNELVKEGQLVTRPVDPKNQDLVFDNWYKDPNFSVVWKFEEFVITNDTTIYAKFNEKIVSEKVSVKFVLEDNTIIQELEYSLNSKIDIPLEPVKEGFIFEGWFLNGKEYDFNTLLTNNVTLVGKFTEEEVVSFVITLELNGGNLDETTLTVNEGETFTLPTPIHPLGFIFIGWFDSNNVKFNQTVTNEDITLFAKYQDANVNNYNYSFGTYPEAIWIEIEEDNSEIEVFYKLSENETYIKVDSELIIIGPSKTTINIVGLSMGHYDVKIIFNEVNELVINQINVKAHDRSGYAHFNYNEGIGAYNDDGTLKDDAIVVYVTEENKNTITIPGIAQTGLGWILNNAQYSSSSSNTQNSTDYNNSLAKFNKPIVFRIIGKVTAPEGVTAYNSTNNGGSIGDNGNMARIKDANHITIEGIGQGAEIHGWGIHFMASTVGRGIGFEVRNITFDKYPEDAIGLEGIQSGGILTIPVQRGWIHNSTFKQGYS